MISFFRTILYEPMYNGLILLEQLIPQADLGVIVILFTLIIKTALMPLSARATRTQIQMKEIEPEIKALKEKFKNNKEKLAQETMALYKQHNIRPFSGFLVLLIQFPIIISLYYIFLRGGLNPVDTDLLYSFVQAPETLNSMFLGLVDITKRSIPLALFTGITQFISVKILSFGRPKNNKKFGTGSLKEDLTRGMQVQMQYVFPLIITFIAYTLPAAVSIYWMTNNVFQIFQEMYLKRVRKKEVATREKNKEASQEKTKEGDVPIH